MSSTLMHGDLRRQDQGTDLVLQLPRVRPFKEGRFREHELVVEQIPVSDAIVRHFASKDAGEQVADMQSLGVREDIRLDEFDFECAQSGTIEHLIDSEIERGTSDQVSTVGGLQMQDGEEENVFDYVERMESVDHSMSSCPDFDAVQQLELDF